MASKETQEEESGIHAGWLKELQMQMDLFRIRHVNPLVREKEDIPPPILAFQINVALVSHNAQLQSRKVSEQLWECGIWRIWSICFHVLL